MMYHFLVSIIFVLALSGCRTQPTSYTEQPSVYPAAPFNAFYQRWRGTPYQLGGTTQRGIDCSAFVQQAYQAVLAKKLPRTTLKQSQMGMHVGLGQWQVGDLVFFKTEYKQRHVGIYIGKGHFMHASTSAGVTITALNNPYWKTRYWVAKRY